MSSADIGLFVAIFVTLATLSRLYRDNPFYKLVEHLFVGVALGYVVVLEVLDVLRPKLFDTLIGSNEPVSSVGWYAVVALLCLLMLSRWVPRIGWLARIPFAVVVGALVGFGAQGFLRGILMPQLGATVRGVVPTAPALEEIEVCLRDGGALAEVYCRHGAWAEGVLIAIIVAASLYYLFGARRTARSGAGRALGALHSAGRWLVLVGFGAAFGFAVMEYIAVATGRAQLLIDSPGASLLAVLLIVGGLGLWGRTSGTSPDADHSSAK